MRWPRTWRSNSLGWCDPLGACCRLGPVGRCCGMAVVGQVLRWSRSMRRPVLACDPPHLLGWMHWPWLHSRAWPHIWRSDPLGCCDLLASCCQRGPTGRCCGPAGGGMAPLWLRLMHWPVRLSNRWVGCGRCVLRAGRRNLVPGLVGLVRFIGNALLVLPSCHCWGFAGPAWSYRRHVFPVGLRERRCSSEVRVSR